MITGNTTVCQLVVCLFCLVGTSLAGEKELVVTRPLIWVQPSDRAAILSKIKNNAWAKGVLAAMKARVANAMKKHGDNPDVYLRGLPIDWDAPKGPVFKKIMIDRPSKDGHIRAAAHRYLLVGIDCGVLYFVTGEEAYGQCAADILHNFTTALLALPPEKSGVNAGWVFRHDHLKEARVFGAQIPVLYDFVYPFVTEPERQVYDVASKKRTRFDCQEAQQVFRTYHKLACERGYAGHNWPVLESPSLVHNALALDDPKERAAALSYYFEKDTKHQDSLKTVARKYQKRGDIWPEPLGYAECVSAFSTYLMTLLERQNQTAQLYKQYPNIPASLKRYRELRYPNNEVIRFGDMGRHSRMPYAYFEMVYAHAKARGYATLAREFGSMIAGGVAAGKYDRSRPLPHNYGPTPYFAPLQLLWSAAVVTEKADSLVYPRSDQLPFAGIVLQRNLSTTKDPLHGLMFFVGGAHYVHAHATGMNMELYGRGQVLGAEAGSVGYHKPIQAEYYRLHAAHNTIIVNGASRGAGGWKGLGMDRVRVVAMEPRPRAPAVSPSSSFTCTSFNDDRGKQTQAVQERTLALVRTSATTGYYVDIFRSRSRLPKQFHDYIYHNIGESPVLEVEGRPLPLTKTPERFQNDIGSIDYKKTSFKQPGWRYFTRVETSKPCTAPVTARFIARLPQEEAVMSLHIPGGVAREYSRVLTPPIMGAPKPYTGKAAPALVIRQQGPAWQRPFAVVFEPRGGKGSVTRVTRLDDGKTFIGLRVESLVKGKHLKQYVLSNPEPSRTVAHKASGIRFTGRFAILTTDADGALQSLYMGDGLCLEYGETVIQSATGKSAAGEICFRNDRAGTCSPSKRFTVVSSAGDR